MKKYILIGLVVLVGGALLIAPLLKDDAPVVNNTKKKGAAVFTFKDNLATVGDEVVPLEIEINKDASENGALSITTA